MILNSERIGSDAFQAAMGCLDQGITIQDASGELVYANAAAARMLGLESPQAMLQQGRARLNARFELFDESGEPMDWERLPGRAILAGREPTDLLFQFRADHGALRWSRLRAHRAEDEQGELLYVVNVFEDVTEAQRRAVALELSEQWFSTALRSIGDAVVATDAEGRVTFANPVAEQLTGWSADEARGRPLREVFRIVNEYTREPTESPVERVLRDGGVVGLANHTILLQRDGGELAIDDSAAPIIGPQGETVGVVLVFRDVSKARRAAQRQEFLAGASVELSSSLDYSVTLAKVAQLAVPTIADWCAVDMLEGGEIRRLAVAHVDPEKVAFVQEIERRWPVDMDAPQGVPNILRTGEPEMLRVIPEEVLESGARDEAHLRVIRELQLRSYIGVPLTIGDETFGVITLVMAESRRTYDEDDLELAGVLAQRASTAVQNARLYRAAEDARREAETANRTKDEFLAMLGHELRNPLAPIVTALELMKMRGDGQGSREREVVERQVMALQTLVDDLLDVSRITRGRIELDRAPVELADVVDKSVEVVGTLIETRRHALHVDVPRGLVVDGDASRLAQVVNNLLTNAAKYTEPEGQIWVTGAREGDEVVLRVRDSGIGIPPQMLSGVFDVFHQAPQALDRAQGGLGLGLTIARSLVEGHGGTITAKSAGVGRGAELEMRLPASQRDVEPPEPAAESQFAEHEPEAGTPILVVDDNSDALEMIVAVLEVIGYRPLPASDPAAALELAQQTLPPLALLDLGLPVIDGYELGRRLRAIPGLADIKLIAATGYGQPSDRERTTAAGFAAHLVKPIALDELRRVLEELDPTVNETD